MRTINFLSEHDEQVALCLWWQFYCTTQHIDERLLYAIPNGGKRNAITGARLKAEGVRAGLPDLCLAIPNKGYHGLYLELKREGGKVSKAQREMHHALAAQGYAVQTCVGWQAAQQVIEAYLGSLCHD